MHLDLHLWICITDASANPSHCLQVKLKPKDGFFQIPELLLPMSCIIICCGQTKAPPFTQGRAECASLKNNSERSLHCQQHQKRAHHCNHPMMNAPLYFPVVSQRNDILWDSMDHRHEGSLKARCNDGSIRRATSFQCLADIAFLSTARVRAPILEHHERLRKPLRREGPVLVEVLNPPTVIPRAQQLPIRCH